MLKFDIGDKELHLERDDVEAMAQQMIAAKLEQAAVIEPSLHLALKGVAKLLMSTIGLKAPKDADKLEFLSAYILKLGLDAMETKVIPVRAKEVLKVDKTDTD